MHISEEDVRVEAERRFKILRPPSGISSYFHTRKFIASFGCEPGICVLLWNAIDDSVEPLLHFGHLMWFLSALFFLNTYPTMSVLSTMLGKNEDTVRKWVWHYIDLLARLPFVSQYLPAFQPHIPMDNSDNNDNSDNGGPLTQADPVGEQTDER